MRTIKFRSKTLGDNNVWVFGDLHIRSAFAHIHTDLGTKSNIDTDTIGQFTGLYDKDGKEIYEGDLIEVNGRLFGIVEWHKDGYFFINDTIVGVRSDGGEYSPIGEMIRYFSNHGHDFSVIGNIHDNPELLKGGDQ